MEEGDDDASSQGQRLCLLSTLLQVVARADDDEHTSPQQESDGLAIPEHICQAILVELLELMAKMHACRKRHRYIRPWTVAITSGGRLELAGGKGFEDSRSSANSSAESFESFVDGAQVYKTYVLVENLCPPAYVRNCVVLYLCVCVGACLLLALIERCWGVWGIL